ncbi:hypothetical protein HNQ80_000385 [Anaerosolibacter carboniphilus]|uniref:BioF2-like acetyltransferase domain-containing protein n=1 Tax=Anaerosolibacter carboniphilus TaxID=1417629 RepID=A0A841KLN5_9FIRM|nr:GNAT family N-acetyltransferase [Anaerosolibacter carboniphilus]MBB6214316.1 hypothetical protein [Anaerosolibacter carboniphilus]
MDLKVELFDESNIDQIKWPRGYDGEYARNYLIPLIKEGTDRYINNIKTKLMILSIDNILLPITINESEYDNSYVCSPYTHYVSYSIEELKELKEPKLESGFRFVLNILGSLLKAGKVNKTIHVNNWLVSTNLYATMTKEQVQEVTGFLSRRFPGYTIVFRSLNQFTNSSIFDSFGDLGFEMIASRRAYIFDPHKELNSKARHILKKDRKVLEDSDYVWVDAGGISSDDIDRLLSLYNQLYLDKYSYLNPQFSREFIKLALNSKILELFALKDSEEIKGTIGFFHRNGVMTTPFFGYDLKVSKEAGLYRILSLKLMEEARSRNLILHQSSGAGEFKKCRGGVPVVEYSAVYIKQLPLFRKAVWKMLSIITNKIAMPIIIEKGL